MSWLSSKFKQLIISRLQVRRSHVYKSQEISGLINLEQIKLQHRVDEQRWVDSTNFLIEYLVWDSDSIMEQNVVETMLGKRLCQSFRRWKDVFYMSLKRRLFKDVRLHLVLVQSERWKRNPHFNVYFWTKYGPNRTN